MDTKLQVLYDQPELRPTVNGQPVLPVSSRFGCARLTVVSPFGIVAKGAQTSCGRLSGQDTPFFNIEDHTHPGGFLLDWAGTVIVICGSNTPQKKVTLP